MIGQYTIQAKVKTEAITTKGTNTVPSQLVRSKAPSDHQLQEAEGGRSFGGRFNSQPRRLFCLIYGEDKGHTTRTYQVTIQKQKEIDEAEAQRNQPKQVLHTASCYSPYIPKYVGNQ
jgi:hypothetical protein